MSQTANRVLAVPNKAYQPNGPKSFVNLLRKCTLSHLLIHTRSRRCTLLKIRQTTSLPPWLVHTTESSPSPRATAMAKASVDSASTSITITITTGNALEALLRRLLLENLRHRLILIVVHLGRHRHQPTAIQTSQAPKSNRQMFKTTLFTPRQLLLGVKHSTSTLIAGQAISGYLYDPVPH